MRGSLAPLVMGMRWATGGGVSDHPQAPATERSLGLGIKIALDEFFFATELYSGGLVSLGDRHRLSQELGGALALYERNDWLDRPAEYHRRPPRLDRVLLDEAGAPWGRFRRMRFESGYAPHEGEPGRQRWLAYAANRTAHAWILEHEGEQRPWMVCVPGYRMGTPLIDFTGFRARWLHEKLGLNVAIPVLPLHGPRRIGRRTGDGFLTGDFVDTVHAEAQAVWDLRRLIGWLRTNGAPSVAVHGVSLGGYTAALLSGLEEDIDCVIAGVPAIDFIRLLSSHAPDFAVRLIDWMGYSFERIETLLRVVSPLAMEPQVARKRRYVYAGAADRLALPDHALDLWEHWERPEIAWYQGSHISFLWEPAVKHLITDALADNGLLRVPRSPSQRREARERRNERRVTGRRATDGSFQETPASAAS